MVGKTLGHYEIVEPLGKGGMGEVYRARDTTLKRDVAIKVLPEDLADDPDRLARLEREAHLLAALNHPNIATIHSLERAEETRFLVMELVKGESLEQRLAKGPLPTEAALDLCRQIAEALEAAHGEGIIHRDLKPANVLITPDGRAKVLDFGLAKAFESNASAGDISQSPTLTIAGTQAGVILGTAPYMSPEQVRGLPLDKRVDIWAFGCVVYETLTASRAFARETIADTLAAILEAEPNWGALPAATPPMVDALVKRCLRKDPDRRLHDIADARIEIEEALSEPTATAPALVRPPLEGRARVLPWAIAAIAIVVAAVAIGTRPSGSDDGVAAEVMSETPYSLPAGVRIAANRLVVSPDGSRFYFIARKIGEQQSSVWEWVIGEREPVQFEGTEGARAVFATSPAGDWLIYHVDPQQELWRVQTSGVGSSMLVGPSRARGTIWFEDDTLMYVPENRSGFQRGSLGGRISTTLTELEDDEAMHFFPQLLPDGKTVLFTVGNNSQNARLWSLATISLEGDGPQEPKIFWESGGSYARYVPTYGPEAPTGHLLVLREGTIVAVPFDLASMQPSGLEVLLVDETRPPGPYGNRTPFDVTASGNGTLVYLGPASPPMRQLMSLDMAGDSQPLELLPGNGVFFREFLERVPRFASQPADLLAVAHDDAGRPRVSVYQEGQIDTRFVVEGRAPVWSPDGQRLAFSHDLGGNVSEIMILDRTANSEEPKRIFVTQDGVAEPLAFSNDETALIYLAFNGIDLDIREFVFETKEDNAWQATAGVIEDQAVLSPNGEWLAYRSNKFGRDEVYLRAYSPGEPPGAELVVSRDGGSSAGWSADGTKLFYRRGDEMMVVEIGTDPVSEMGPAVAIFELPFPGDFRVRPDGTGFVMWQRIVDPDGRAIHPVVVRNLFEGLKRLVPAGR